MSHFGYGGGMVDSQNETDPPGKTMKGLDPITLPEADAPDGPVEGDDAALDRIWGNLEGADADAPATSNFAPEEPAVAVEPAAAPTVEEASVEPVSPPEAPAPSTDQPDDDAYRSAAASMRRDGWSTEDVALLPRERVIAIGEKRLKVQGDMDTNMAELTTLRADRGTARENEARRENEAEAAPAKVDVSKLAERLALDDEGAQELADTLRGLQAPLLEQIQELRQGLAGERQSGMKAAAESARQGLAERFPQLQDPASDSFKRVLNRMTRLQSTGNYSSVAELMEDSTLLEFRDEIAAQASANTQKLRQARANGQMKTSGAASKDKPKARTQEQHEKDVFDILMDETKPRDQRQAAANALQASRLK